jgi:S-formylglutathione hydrolase FrmB
MSWGTLSFRSQILMRPMAFNFLLPDPWAAGPGPYPVLYLLHGYSDDHQAWLLQSRLLEYVAGLPLVVVMPDAEHSFYCDAYEGEPFERYLLEEVRGLVEKCFAVRKSGRRARCVGGLSMGGFGAMKLGLRYPDLFASVGAHSSAMDVARHAGGDTPIMRDLRRLLGPARGDNPHRCDNDPFLLAQQVDRAQLPALYFDCGTEDQLLPSNREFDRLLTKLDLPHVYQEYPGDHSWGYWDQHIQDSLAHHCRALGIKRR